MIKSRKDELLKLINFELGRAKLTKDTDSGVKDFDTVSWSQSGDKFQYEGALDITKMYFEKLTKLLDEVKSAPDTPLAIAKPICYVELKYLSGERVKLYLVENYTLVPGILLITSDSPIGGAIYGKKQGDKFSYEIVKEANKITYFDRNKLVYSGKIENIE